MKTKYEINAAINAAEQSAKPLARASEPVTVTQEILCTLLEAAKGNIDKIADLEDQLEGMRNAIRAS